MVLYLVTEQVLPFFIRIPSSTCLLYTSHLEKRVEEIHEGKYDDLIEQIMQKPITDMEELYNNREIEK